jgi:formate dehydrogenase (coenzyme F420) alpha subunit
LFMTETAEHADYVLPAANQMEFSALAYNYNVCHCMPYIMLRRPLIPRYYETKTIREIYTELAARLGFGDKFPWKSDDELIAQELSKCELNYQALIDKPEGGFYQQKTYELKEGSFATPSGKIEIFSEAFERVGFDPLPTYKEPDKSPQGPRWKDLGRKYPLILSAGTRFIHSNNSTMHNVESLQKRDPFPRAEIGPETARKYGITDMDDVIIESDRGWVKMKASVSEWTMEGSVFVPHGWPGEANCNRLTDAQCREPITGYPQWKSLLCNIRKAENQPVNPAEQEKMRGAEADVL